MVGCRHCSGQGGGARTGFRVLRQAGFYRHVEARKQLRVVKAGEDKEEAYGAGESTGHLEWMLFCASLQK